MALICLPKFPQRQPRASFPKYPRLWRCPQSLCQCLRNGPTHFVKVRGWMGGQINEQTKGQLWKARKLLSPYAHMRFYKNELSLSYCLVTVTKYFQTLFRSGNRPSKSCLLHNLHQTLCRPESKLTASFLPGYRRRWLGGLLPSPRHVRNEVTGLCQHVSFHCWRQKTDLGLCGRSPFCISVSAGGALQ